MKKKIVKTVTSKELKQAIDAEVIATERNDDAEEALLREYHYHMLRAEELRHFLENRGYSL